MYWLLVVILPGYAYFRYPAKLMVIAALGLSQLAAFGLDRLREREPETLRRWTLGFVIFSAAAYLTSLAISPVWSEWTQHVRPDPLYGPFDATGSLIGLRRRCCMPFCWAASCGGCWAKQAASRRAGWLPPCCF